MYYIPIIDMLFRVIGTLVDLDVNYYIYWYRDTYFNSLTHLPACLFHYIDAG